MSTMSQGTQEVVRQAFKYLNHFMLVNWRLGMGPYMSFWPYGFGRFLVLIHTGRKSGLRRRTPINYAEIDGDIYVTVGFGQNTHWYKNVMAHPHVEVWLPDGWWQAEVTGVTGSVQATAMVREVVKSGGFSASYIAAINPHTMGDDELSVATATYRLLRIRRTAPRTGKEGPGDLVWLWPMMVSGLLLIVFYRLAQERNNGAAHENHCDM